MLQTTYSIYSEDADYGHLFIEAGKNHIACWTKDEAQNKFTAFELFQCSDYSGAEFPEIINAAKAHSKLLSAQPATTKFILNTAEVFCLPLDSAHRSDDFIKQNLELLFGPCSDARIFSQAYRELLFVSRIDKNLQENVRSVFTQVQFHSQYACLMPSLISNGDAGVVYLFFYPHYFSLVAFKEGNLQLMQTRAYGAAEEVLYFVLNVFKQYNIDNETEILTGGFIDKESKLYQTLYQYLEGLKPAEVDENLFAFANLQGYSSHYFLPYVKYEL